MTVNTGGTAQDTIERLQAKIKELEAYELMADQLTKAMGRWGWEHCADGLELIDQIDLILRINEELTDIAEQVVDGNFNQAGIIDLARAALQENK